MFTKQEISFMRELGLCFDFRNLSDDEWVEIEEKVGDYLVLHELDKDFQPTPVGKTCESILSKLP